MGSEVGKMQKKSKVTLIGCAIIAVTLILILCAVFLPRLSAKRDMKALLAATLSPDSSHMTYTDPNYENEGFLAGEGREAQLTGETLAAVHEALAVLSEDFSFEKREKELMSGLDRRLWVKTAQGENVQIYFTDTVFYFIDGEITYYFTPKSTENYVALLDAMQGALQ